jgi:hypothetical protein
MTLEQRIAQLHGAMEVSDLPRAGSATSAAARPPPAGSGSVRAEMDDCYPRCPAGRDRTRGSQSRAAAASAAGNGWTCPTRARAPRQARARPHYCASRRRALCAHATTRPAARAVFRVAPSTSSGWRGQCAESVRDGTSAFADMPARLCAVWPVVSAAARSGTPFSQRIRERAARSRPEWCETARQRVGPHPARVPRARW